MRFQTDDFDLLVPDIARAAFARLAVRPAVTVGEVTSEAGADEADSGIVLDALVAAKLLHTLKAGAQYGSAGRQLLYLALDLGGTKLRAGIARGCGTIIAEHVEPTDAQGGLFVVEQIGRVAQALLAGLHLRLADLVGVGLGTPGRLEEATGRILMAPNIKGFDDNDIAGALRARLGLAARIENDVNLAALGERARGACRRADDFAFVSLGTGIGMGLVLNGRLVRGAHGFGGEIAMLPIGTDPFEPANFRLGPLETAIGSAGILDHARRAGARSVDSVRALFDEAEFGGAAAARALDAVARSLAQALLAVKAIADPKAIVLGGGIGLRPELLARLRALFAGHPYAPAVLPSALGDHAVLAGAAHVALGETVRRAMHATASGGRGAIVPGAA